MKKGEKVFVLMHASSGNVFARNEEGEEGLLPSHCLRPEDEDCDVIEEVPVNTEAPANTCNSNNVGSTSACVKCAKKQSIAVLDFSSKVAGDIHFKAGDRVEILDDVDREWYRGRKGDQIGIFPKSFVSPPVYPTYTALYAFQGRKGDELNFTTGDEITLIGRIDGNWLQGTCMGKTGRFPAAFIQNYSL